MLHLVLWNRFNIFHNFEITTIGTDNLTLNLLFPFSTYKAFSTVNNCRVGLNTIVNNTFINFITQQYTIVIILVRNLNIAKMNAIETNRIHL